MPMQPERAAGGAFCSPPEAKTVATAANTADILPSQVPERKRRCKNSSPAVTTNSETTVAAAPGIKPPRSSGRYTYTAAQT